MPFSSQLLAMIQQSLAVVVAITTVAVLVAATFVQRYQFNKKYKLPVRIPGIPFFGNSFQLPPLQQGPWAKKMAEKYGEMYVCRHGCADDTIDDDRVGSRASSEAPLGSS